MVDYRRRMERRRAAPPAVGKGPCPVVSLLVTLVIVTAPWWTLLVGRFE